MNRLFLSQNWTSVPRTHVRTVDSVRIWSMGLNAHALRGIPGHSAKQVSEHIFCRRYFQCVHGSFMMTSSNGNIFRVTGPLWGESTGDQWIPLTQRPLTQSFDVFFDMRLNNRLSKQSWHRWFETPVHSLWRHCYDSRWSNYMNPGYFTLAAIDLKP